MTKDKKLHTFFKFDENSNNLTINTCDKSYICVFDIQFLAEAREFFEELTQLY